MTENALNVINEKIRKEKPLYGDFNIKLVFHNGKLTRFDFSKTEINLLREGKKDEK